MVLKTINKKLDNWTASKQAKYKGLSNDALLKKDLKKNLNSTRYVNSTLSVGTSGIAGHGFTAAFHGPYAVHQAAKSTKNKALQEVSRSIIEERGLKRIEPSFGQKVRAVGNGWKQGTGYDTLVSLIDK